MKRVAIALLATCALSLLPVAGPTLARTSAVAAPGDEFYTPPATLGSGRPGHLIRSEPMTAYGLPAVPLPARAWRIMYRSATAIGRPIAVTGTVLVPTIPWTGPGERPLIGFAPGTQGLADRCAPSRQFAAGTEYESAIVTQALLKGWAVALTDYQGLGTPGDHAYVVGRSLGRNVLDAVRAARNLPEAGLSPAGPVAIYGYSEGGGAAAWALQLQPTYAPELPIAAGAVGATATDSFKLLEHHDGGPFAFLLIYAAIGFDAVFPELDLSSYLKPAGVQAVNQARNTCIQDAIVQGLLADKQLSTYVDPNPMSSPVWVKRLKENDLGYIAPRPPVLIGGSRNDEVFPYEQEELLHQRWCERGVNAHLVEVPLPEHIVVAIGFSGPALQFIADRFAGKPLARACTRAPAPTPTPTPTPTPSSTPAPSPQAGPQPAPGPSSSPPAVDTTAQTQNELPLSVDAGLSGEPAPDSGRSTGRSGALALTACGLGLLLATCACVWLLGRRARD